MSQVNIKTKMLEGRPHFVVPTVMITVGVHNGSQGPLFYSANALRESVPFWSGKPIVVYHPCLFGKASAGDPEVFNTQKIGTVFNTRFNDGKLHAEAWIDEERVKQVDMRVYRAILKKQMIEVSTGLFSEGNPEGGTWNGKAFNVIAANLRPDHLAVLPDQVGACSLADGAGLVRNNENKNGALLMPEMSF